jgi:hypothetical protein
MDNDNNPRDLLKPEIPDYSDTTRYRHYRNGAIYDLERGRIVAMDGENGTTLITKENAREYQRRGRQALLISQLRGLAGTINDLPPDEKDLEAITQGAATVIEALTKHYARTFLKSNNLRGMAESYAKLVSPLLGDDETDQDRQPDQIPARAILILAELARKKVIDVPPAE